MPPPSPPPPASYLPTLDGWRAVAILAVIVCHAFGGQQSGGWHSLVLNLGQQGVSLFFAISGYLITTLLLEEYRRHGAIDLRGFYIRRVCRIFPPAYLYLLTLLVLASAGLLQLADGEIASAFFMYNNYWPSRGWYSQHFWSLSMEEHFYLVWPFVLAAAGARRSAWIAVAVIAATVVWRPWALQHVELNVAALQRTDMRLDAFLFAALLAIVLHDRPAWRQQLTAARHLSAMGLLGAAYAFSLVYGWQLTKLFWQSALMPFIVVGTIYTGPSYWAARWLEWPPLRWFGRISYSLYLWQQLIFHSDAVSFAGAARNFPLRFALVVALAAASHYWLERPLLRWGRSWSARRTA